MTGKLVDLATAQEVLETAFKGIQLNQQEPHTYPLREVLRGMRAS